MLVCQTPCVTDREPALAAAFWTGAVALTEVLAAKLFASGMAVVGSIFNAIGGLALGIVGGFLGVAAYLAIWRWVWARRVGAPFFESRGAHLRREHESLMAAMKAEAAQYESPEAREGLEGLIAEMEQLAEDKLFRGERQQPAS